MMKSDSSNSDPSNTAIELPPLLASIDSPCDLKKIPIQQLPELAQEIRDLLIQSLAHTGGHLGPNLGVVELTIALHYVFNTPDDKFLMDVSHQGYIHKLLTGRAKEFHTIRTYEGLNGFLLRTESEHDCYGAGHAGTALSAALGMASARDLKGEDFEVVALAGDAAFTCGPTLEALNNVNDATKNFTVILNDNEWSIDKNVGAISRHLNSIKRSSTYEKVRSSAADFIKNVAGDRGVKFAQMIKNNTKALFLPSVLFEQFGLRYYGPIDGHDIEVLIKTLTHIKENQAAVVLHIITEKGRGYKPAIDNPGKFHGLGAYRIENGATASASLPTFSEIFGNTVTNFAKEDKMITAITAAMPGGTKLDIFKNELPERYFDVGIAEEHAALFACGHACEGLKPFLTIYSTFMQRAYDMIIHDIALQNLPVRICLDRAGLSGDDGPTHHGLFDIGYLRHVPNLIIMQPKDEDEFVDMLYTMKEYDDGPTVVRYPRGAGMGATLKESPVKLEIGKAELISEGDDVLLLGLGHLFEVALETKVLLEAAGHSVTLINPRFIKPLDAEMICRYAESSKVICTFEDHAVTNGFGSAISELLHQRNIFTPLECVGWPDQFVEHGKVEILRELHGITATAAQEKILTHLNS
ncbi:1-deoxy-D-xylulose-5-phosphate synthase [Akkermansiaceae bacterium]|nr:1-deoxy-D-xylulose-5-phosphate synthase [Akkermansiaceae bacterium]